MDNETKNRIINAAILAFNEDGVRFTMDSVAASIGISKKTIYKFFKSKDDLILAAIDAGFDEVKIAEQRIMSDDSLDIIEKIKRVITVIPDQYITIDWRRLQEFETYYPAAFKLINARVSTGWDNTFALLNTAMKEGRIKSFNIYLFKSMIESCIAGFISNGTLLGQGIEYKDALNMMIEIIIEGIRK